jgi:hypothetical protein
MSAIIDFYRGDKPDIHGRMIGDILKWDNHTLENIHTYIQWLFPLDEKSSNNRLAPILTPADIAEIQSSQDLKERFIASFKVILSFYGFTLFTDDTKTIGSLVIRVEKSDNFEERAQNWLTRYNHNYLRITRILKCFKLIKLNGYGCAFFNALCDVYHSGYEALIGPQSFCHWQEVYC